MKRAIVLFSLIFLGLTACKTSPKTWTYSKTISLENVQPVGILVENQNIWLSDVKNNRVVKLNMAGEILKEYSDFNRPMHIALENSQVYVPEYLTDSIKIINDDEVVAFNLMDTPDAPASVAVSGNTLAVADFYNHRIIVQQDSTSISFGEEGHDNGELYYPTDVQFFGDLIYVADAYNNRVQVFDKNGKFQKVIGSQDQIIVATGLFVTEKNIFVCVFEGNRVLIYDLEGSLVQTLSDNFIKPIDAFVSKETLYVANYDGNSVVIFKLQ